MKLLPILLFLLCLIACRQKEDGSVSSAANLNTSNNNAKNESNEAPGNKQVDITTKLIKEASLRFEVKDIDYAGNQLHLLNRKYEAYMSNETKSDQENRKEFNATIRVPALKLDSLIRDILLLSIKLDTKNIETKDVTEEYIDINARLNSKRELESTYINLLKQTHNVNEVLNIEKELSVVRGDIEFMEARLKYLTSQIRFSTIEISCYEVIHANSNLWKQISLGITGGWFALIKFVIFLFRAWPLLILLFIILYFRKRRYRNK